jgi:hypothetical protein
MPKLRRIRRPPVQSETRLGGPGRKGCPSRSPAGYFVAGAPSGPGAEPCPGSRAPGRRVCWRAGGGCCPGLPLAAGGGCPAHGARVGMAGCSSCSSRGCRIPIGASQSGFGSRVAVDLRATGSGPLDGLIARSPFHPHMSSMKTLLSGSTGKSATSRRPPGFSRGLAGRASHRRKHGCGAGRVRHVQADGRPPGASCLALPRVPAGPRRSRAWRGGETPFPQASRSWRRQCGYCTLASS